ncbi:MAG: hypothetical protein ACODAG_09360 [Myxococcota bacterium]
MAGFIRRYDSPPTREQLLEIEAVNIVDIVPTPPLTGVGSGTVLVVGEWEDGPFAAGGDAEFLDSTQGKGPTEVFNTPDYERKFGGFGHKYGSDKHRHVCARKRLGEFFNGNGFLKTKYMKAGRFIFARVDTRVGEVVFNALACISGGKGPFALSDGDTISVTTDQGGAEDSDAISASAATVAGAAGTFPTEFSGGETIQIGLDGGNSFDVVFSAADQTAADVIARINAAAGFSLASENGGEVDFTSQILGTDSEIELIEVTSGALSTIGHSEGTTSGSGNVGNVDEVTAAEVASVINGSAALDGIGASARLGQDGRLRICSTTAAVGSVEVASGDMATALGLDPLDTTVDAGVHSGGKIPAGTRVEDGSQNQWLTMQTLTIPEGTSDDEVGGPFAVAVRPVLDDGSAPSASAGDVTTVVDAPDWAELSVNNPADLSAALTEAQVDVAYEDAFDATLNPNGIVREVNYSLSARRSPAVIRKGIDNANEASNQGHFGRKFATRGKQDFTLSQARQDVADFRDDRMFYTWPGWRVRIPEIAEVGLKGGPGFTSDGIITIGADGPLTSINAVLPPEEDPGQDTGLLAPFFEVQDVGVPLTIESYKALKAAGICAPRVDEQAGSIYQSGITSSLVPGEENQARRKMADFIQDTLARDAKRFSKKLSKESRRDAWRGNVETFLGGLRSENQPELQRIHSFNVTEQQTSDEEALGIFRLVILVRTLASMKALVLQTTIGESVEIEEAA